MKSSRILLGVFVNGLTALVLNWQACAQELRQVSNPPVVGTFYLLSSEVADTPSPPYPLDPYYGALPVYQLEGFPNSYLVADSPEDYAALQKAARSQESSGTMIGGGLLSGGGAAGSLLDGFLYSTNDLWLEILSPGTNGFNLDPEASTIVLHNPSAQRQYLLESRTTLAADSFWKPEYSLVAAEGTNILPFTVSMLGNPILFFRAVDVSPIAVPGYFSVEQESYQNQLNVLKDVYDPSDDYLLIASEVSAQHGDITYSLDGSDFQYTPDFGFYGIDSFAYNVTNLHEGSASSTITVFVNEYGNTAPVANDVTLVMSVEQNATYRV